MMYNAEAYTRDNAINHASVASQQFFTGTMETMRGFVFAGGGGGGEERRRGVRVLPLVMSSTLVMDRSATG